MISSLLACASPGPLLEAPLLIEQLDLGSRSTGESALIVGPDGTSVLIDVGNDAHDDEVRAALELRTGRDSPDYTLITHFHADHVGGLSDLGDFGALIWRGGVQPDTDEWVEPDDEIALCTSAGCDLPFVLDLGDEATLEVLVAGGVLPDGTTIEITEENARSLVGVVRYGDFAYLFAGDLTGGGKDTEDVESFLANRIALPDVDVAHISHHGIASSTNSAWVDAVFPDDGHIRHGIVGANRAYLSAPDEEVLERLGPRVEQIWVTTPGSLADPHPRCTNVDGSIGVHVDIDG
ncbi:MAG TPA: MBL fold metallo-hydrolase [Myxococcota bacterium]|nr:MBL fold metallo-hydrolase [Myxococcota bacterium]